MAGSGGESRGRDGGGSRGREGGGFRGWERRRGGVDPAGGTKEVSRRSATALGGEFT